MNLYCIFMLVAVLAIFTAKSVITAEPRATNTDEDEYDEAPRICTKRDGNQGVCVDHSLCGPDDTILIGGNIHESELRSIPDCPSLTWCCSLPENKTNITNKGESVKSPPRTGKCEPLDSDICTWCVTLHKVVDKAVTEREAYCVGSLIGTKTVLTAGSCLIAANSYTIFVRVPESASPKHNYYSKNQHLHPLYNSGSHWYDFGIIELEENIIWGEGVPQGAPQGACLGASGFTDLCFTYGLGLEDRIISTKIDKIMKSCPDMGGVVSSEGVCGWLNTKYCFATYGAPVICENEKLELVGVVRSDCTNRNVALGVIRESLNWTTSVFKTLNIAEDTYIAGK